MSEHSMNLNSTRQKHANGMSKHLLKTYQVVYRIEVDSFSPESAALQIEKILRNMMYRPCLEVYDDKKMVEVDLETANIDEL
jgi:hypothetical protein